MSKRFTDTNKWDKLWFRKLTPIEKCFWVYILDRCNHAGFWEVDWETASHYIGQQVDIDAVKQSFKKQYKELNEGKIWFIQDFIDFQYGTLNPENRAHKSVIDLMSKEGAYKGLIRPLLGRKDKDKDKDMVKDVKDLKTEVKEGVHLKSEEVQKLKTDLGDAGYEWCISKLSAYKLSNDKKYKSDYGAILHWVKDEYKKNHIKPTPVLSNSQKVQIAVIQQNMKEPK